MSMLRGPQRATLFLTTHCNLECSYCYVKRGAELPLTFWKECLRQLCQLKCMHVTLTGGEPLIRKDFCEILESVTANRMRFSVTSNGTLVTEQFLQEFLPFVNRCDYFQVSVDGPEKIHNAVRGAGSFQKLSRSTAMLLNAGVPVQAKITLGTHNADQFEDTVEAVFDQLQIPLCSLNYVQNFPGHFTDKCLDLKKFGTLMRKFEALLKRYPGRFLAEGPYPVWKQWQKNEPCMSRNTEVCSAGRDSFNITADGSVFRCISLNEKPLGNLQQKSLAEILENSGTGAVMPCEECISCTLSCAGRCSCTGSLCLKEYLDAGGVL